jgi:hypothetical protein
MYQIYKIWTNNQLECIFVQNRLSNQDWFLTGLQRKSTISAKSFNKSKLDISNLLSTKEKGAVSNQIEMALLFMADPQACLKGYD